MSKRQLVMALALVILIGIAVAGFNAWSAYAQGPNPGDNPSCGQGYGYGRGMMGGYGMGYGGHRGGRGMGMGMMDDCPAWDGSEYGFGMMGHGMMGMMNGWAGPNNHMMDTWTPPQELAPAAGTLLTQEGATKIAEAYLATLQDQNLVLGDVVQFNRYFHAIVTEKDGGNFAFMFMIDASTGQVWSHDWQSQQVVNQ